MSTSDSTRFRALPLQERLNIIAKGDIIPLKYFTKTQLNDYCNAKLETLAEALAKKTNDQLAENREQILGQEASVSSLYEQFNSIVKEKDELRKQISSLQQLNKQLIDKIKQLEEKKEDDSFVMIEQKPNNPNLFSSKPVF